MPQFCNRSQRKTQCEECLQLDARVLLRRADLRFNQSAQITWPPFSQLCGEASAQFRINATEGSEVPSVRLSYGFDRYTLWPKEKPAAGDYERKDFTIHTDATPQKLNGCRYWFLCSGCGHRARVLYLPQGQTEFHCRSCHGLTYRSAQEWKTKMGMMRKKAMLDYENHMASECGPDWKTLERGLSGLKRR